MNAVDEIVQRVMSSRRLRRPVPSYREFAATVKHYAGPPHIKGTPYRVGSEPSQAYLLEQFDSGRWKRFFVCAPPQFGGKTLVAIICTLLRLTIGARLPVGYGLPTLADLDKAWAEKLKPGIKGSGYGDHLPAAGPGARGGRGHTLQLTDPETGEAEGIIVYLAGGGYGSTVAGALIDEIDQFRSAQTGEPLWEAIEDIFNRANAFGSLALRIGAGTIEHDTRSIILPLVFEQGTGTVPHPRCPHCRRWVRFDDDLMVYDRADEQTAAETVRLGCPSCATALTEDDRQQALRDLRYPHKGQTVDEHGAIQGPEPRTDALGLWWPALCSPLADMRELAKEHFRAQQRLDASAGTDHGLMRKYWRYRRCQVYLRDQSDESPASLTIGRLAARSQASTYELDLGKEVHAEGGDSVHVAKKPEGMEFLALTQDVQRGGERVPGRNYFLLKGWAADRRSWDLAWGHLVACPAGRTPSEAELHACLERVHALGKQLAEDFGVPLLRRGVDVGDRLPEIRRWLVRHPDWHAVRGVDATRKATEPQDIQGCIYRRLQEGGWHLYEIDVHEMRQRAQNAFLVPAGKPGAAHLPQGLATTSALIAHYCATALIPDGRGGLRWSRDRKDRQHHGDWQKRRDLLDCSTYNVALAEMQIRDLTRPKPPPRRFGVVGDINLPDFR